MHANEGPFQHRAQTVIFFLAICAHSTERLHSFFLYETLYSMKTIAEKDSKITSGRILNNIFSLLAWGSTCY